MIDNEKAARKKKIAHALMWVLLLVLFICFIFPFLLVIINVFKTKADITSNPLALIGAHGFTLKNFPEAMSKMNFWTVFGNSLIITVSATLLTIVVSSMAAFVIVRNSNWKICTLMFSLMIASMVIPFQVLMVPLVSVYGGTLGVLTMEDVIEQLVGDLGEDTAEEAAAEPHVEQMDENTWAIIGNVELYDIEQALGVDIGMEEVDTFTGLVFGELDMIPRDGKQNIELDFKGLHIHITRVEDHQIAYATVTKLPDPESSESSED